MKRPPIDALAWGYLVTGIVAACLTSALWLRWRDYHPMTDYPVQTVLSRVPGVEGPAIVVGGELRVRGTKCTRSDTPVTGSFVFVTIGDPRRVVEGISGTGIRRAGCTTREYANPLPAGVVPGLWQLAGLEIARDGTREQRKAWESEQFQVVAP